MPREKSNSKIKVINSLLTLIYFLVVYVSFKVKQNLIYEYIKPIATGLNVQAVIYVGLIVNAIINIIIMYNILKVIFKLSKTKYKESFIYLFMICNLCAGGILTIILNNYMNLINVIVLIGISNIIIPIIVLLILENLLKENITYKTYLYISILYLGIEIFSVIGKISIIYEIPW